MARYIVTKKNPYLPLSTHVECFGTDCEVVVIEQDQNRAKAKTHKGIILAETTLRPFMMKVLKGGLDKWHNK